MRHDHDRCAGDYGHGYWWCWLFHPFQSAWAVGEVRGWWERAQA